MREPLLYNPFMDGIRIIMENIKTYYGKEPDGIVCLSMKVRGWGGGGVLFSHLPF